MCVYIYLAVEQEVMNSRGLGRKKEGVGRGTGRGGNNVNRVHSYMKFSKKITKF